MTGGGLEYDGDDGVRLFKSVALPLRVTVLPTPYPFSATITISVAHTGLFSLLRCGLDQSAAPPASLRCGSPTDGELKGGAAVAATAAAADSDGDGLSVRGVAQLPLESADVGSRFLQVARCGRACVTRARGTRASDVLTMSMA